MNVWEKSVGYCEKRSKIRKKQLKRTSGRNPKRKREEKKSTTQDDSGVERLQREKERIELKERRLKGIPEHPVFNATK